MKKISIGVSHEFEGNEEYDYDLFNHCKPLLIKMINSLKNNQILPKIGEMIYVDDDIENVVYMVTKICYYKNNFICFWVNDNFLITE